MDGQNTVVLSGVMAENVNHVWPIVEPYIVDALKKTGADKEFSPESIRGMCVDRSMQLWVAHIDNELMAVFVSEIIQYPLRKALAIPFVGSNRHTIDIWIQVYGVFEAYARHSGCSVIKGYGRRGWVKFLGGKMEGDPSVVMTFEV